MHELTWLVTLTHQALHPHKVLQVLYLANSIVSFSGSRFMFLGVYACNLVYTTLDEGTLVKSSLLYAKG